MGVSAQRPRWCFARGGFDRCTWLRAATGNGLSYLIAAPSLFFQVIGDAVEGHLPVPVSRCPMCIAGGRERGPGQDSHGSLDRSPPGGAEPLTQMMPVRCQGCESRAWVLVTQEVPSSPKSLCPCWPNPEGHPEAVPVPDFGRTEQRLGVSQGAGREVQACLPLHVFYSACAPSLYFSLNPALIGTTATRHPPARYTTAYSLLSLPPTSYSSPKPRLSPVRINCKSEMSAAFM